MSSNIKRAQALSSAKTSKVPKPYVQVEGFGEIVKQLQAITLANKKSQEDIIKSINQLSKVILMASEEGIDTDLVVNAITNLESKMAVKRNAPVDYIVNFDRDKYGLMKTGIRMSAEPKKLN